jgi:hypothetical protein
MNFREWFDTFVEEKGLEDVYHVWDLYSPNGTWNLVDSEVVIEFIRQVEDKGTQDAIKTKLVQIDFFNGDVMDFFKYVAQGLVNMRGNYGA